MKEDIKRKETAVDWVDFLLEAAKTGVANQVEKTIEAAEHLTQEGLADPAYLGEQFDLMNDAAWLWLAGLKAAAKEVRRVLGTPEGAKAARVAREKALAEQTPELDPAAHEHLAQVLESLPIQERDLFDLPKDAQQAYAQARAAHPQAQVELATVEGGRMVRLRIKDKSRGGVL
jgi:hypothetical protein